MTNKNNANEPAKTRAPRTPRGPKSTVGNTVPTAPSVTKTTAPAAYIPPARKAYVAPKMRTIFKEREAPDTKVTFNAKIIPHITINREALDKMRLYVEEMDKEIGWLGTTERIENDIIITDVFLFQQEVHATTTEITPEGLAEFAGELLSQPDGMEIWNNMKMWGHSHVRMGITPSSQDDKQMKDFEQAGHDYFLRLIANKYGELKIDVYEYAKGLEFHNVPWFEEEASENANVLSKQQELATLQSQIDAIQAQIESTQKEIESEKDASVEAKRSVIAEEIREKVSDIPVYGGAYRPPFQGAGLAGGAGWGQQAGGWGRQPGWQQNYRHGGNQGWGAGAFADDIQVETDVDELLTQSELSEDEEIKIAFDQNIMRSFLTFADIRKEFTDKDLKYMQKHILSIGDLRHELYYTGYTHLTNGDVSYLWNFLQNDFGKHAN